MANLTTTTHDTNLSPALSIGIAVITGIPVIINIIYVIVCFKTLRKKLHNLLVLTLCISDSFLGISLTWYIIGSLVDSIRANIGACLFQSFAVSYGLVTSYGIILIICLERYVVVKNMNFGAQETLERFKYLMIGGSLAFGFVYTIETIMFTPHVDTIDNCSIPNLYGEQFEFFITFMVGFITFIMTLIIVVTILTSYRIWVIFYWDTKIHPIGSNVSGKIGDDSGSALDRPIGSASGSSTGVRMAERSRKLPYLQISKDERISVTNSRTCTKSHDVAIVNRPDLENNPKNTETQLVEDDRKETAPIQQLIKRLKLERETIKLNKTVRPIKVKTKQFKFDAWEFRAFSTSMIIALTTMIFTGPFVLSYWIDVYTGTRMPQQTRFMLFIPLVMNSIINPFIYAWRIPEIRQEFKRLFKCNH